ncbi:MAG: rod shape-determining protein [Candidatus Dormibacteria bacterium]
MLSKKIGIDLGTTRMMVYVKGEGFVVDEPAVMATDEQGARVLAVGHAAEELIGKGGKARARRPVGEGNVVDCEVTGAMLQYLIGRIVGRQRIFRPDVMLSVGPALTGVQRRAVLEATMQAGAKTAYLIDKPLAAAIGARLPVSTTDGLLIANFGAGSTEIAAIAAGEVLAMESVMGGGQALDHEIEAAVNRIHAVRLKAGEAERLKLHIGSAEADGPASSLEAAALDREGRPVAVRVGTTEIKEAMADSLGQIEISLSRVLAEVPVARRASIQRNGLILTGGGAKLPGLAEKLGASSGLPVRVATAPEACIALGTGMALDNLAVVRRGQHYMA